jgi:quinol monooxygenase YgiN/ketosteroid isomerase-like protein
MPESPMAAVGFAHARPERAKELGQLLSGFAARSRREPGCLESRIHRDREDPHLFVFYESWASEADVATHLDQPYMKQFLAERMDYLSQDLRVHQLEVPLPEPADPHDPAEMNQRYLEAYAARDVDALMAVYAPGAAAVWAPGQSVSGDQHREAMAGFLKREPNLSALVVASYVAGDVAALVVDWTLEVPGDAQLTGSGRGFDVLRRNAEGQWQYVITNPLGRA